MDRITKKIILSDDPLEESRKFVSKFCHNKIIKNIEKCNLCKYGKKSTVPFGNYNADIFVICGNADTNNNINKLKEIISNVGLDINNIYFSYTVNCVFKRKDGSNRLPAYEEAINCRNFIDKEIKFVNPKLIIAMGATIVNAYYPGRSFLYDDERYMYIHNIKTIRTSSISEIVTNSKYTTKENTDQKINDIICAFKYAKEYIEGECHE